MSLQTSGSKKKINQFHVVCCQSNQLREYPDSQREQHQDRLPRGQLCKVIYRNSISVCILWQISNCFYNAGRGPCPHPSTSVSFSCLRLGGNVLLTGEQGSAKTSILNAFTGRYNPEERLYQKSNFSATTTPQIFQKTIETSVDKRMGNTFGPPIGKTMTIFIDDLNQPEVSAWGDQVTMPCCS